MCFLTTAGKGIILLMRAVGLNATTFPGKITYRVGKHLPEYLTSGQNVTLITGTNGKTTTARMLCSVYEKAGYKVISNVSGANLISGIITTLIEHRSIYGTNTRIVLEIDEAAFGRYSGVLSPSCIAVTNLFRDQLDRYGELTRTRDLIRKGIVQAGEARIILCADDSLVASLFPDGGENVTFYGISDNGTIDVSGAPQASAETGNCVFCGTMYDYSARTYGHLGIYGCSGCGFTRPLPDIGFSYKHRGNNYYELLLTDDHKTNVIVPVPGEHNVYNAVTAITAALVSGESTDAAVFGISETSAGFGRMEKFEIGGREVCIVLVKNPVGLDRALTFLSNASDAGGVQFILNDKIADGTDVSWIWDVDFESVKIPLPVHVSGSRGFDIALRLKYSGIMERDIKVDTDVSASFDKALLECAKGKCLYIFPNYTSMLELRNYLKKKFRLKGIWE